MNPSLRVLLRLCARVCPAWASIRRRSSSCSRRARSCSSSRAFRAASSRRRSSSSRCTRSRSLASRSAAFFALYSSRLAASSRSLRARASDSRRAFAAASAARLAASASSRRLRLAPPCQLGLRGPQLYRRLVPLGGQRGYVGGLLTAAGADRSAPENQRDEKQEQQRCGRQRRYQIAFRPRHCLAHTTDQGHVPTGALV